MLAKTYPQAVLTVRGNSVWILHASLSMGNITQVTVYFLTCQERDLPWGSVKRKRSFGVDFVNLTFNGYQNTKWLLTFSPTLSIIYSKAVLTVRGNSVWIMHVSLSMGIKITSDC